MSLIKSQCRFINIIGVFLWPPLTDNSHFREATSWLHGN
jgi:hypothetical protein